MPVGRSHDVRSLRVHHGSVTLGVRSPSIPSATDRVCSAMASGSLRPQPITHTKKNERLPVDNIRIKMLIG